MSNSMRARSLATVAVVALWLLLPTAHASAASKLAVSDSDNNRSIALKLNTQVSISLNSVFWLDATTTNLKLIKDKAQKTIAPGPTAPPGCQHPGTGCGSSTWVFKATKRGKASFTVSRLSCGEALRCSPENSSFLVRFTVK
ncbi:MAG: hypothetical protein F2830_03505 [Actinobacteria bacterium]|nr:hypothetical protein [Actinomycetota bacterium]MSW62708.1 hypothetical protein [Actinomycetota bacterium]MSX89725.1 hypothetical protein [Actinomycetota bacterium]MSZ63557.1 hypothetical protein [Actinomycetota bacterium]